MKNTITKAINPASLFFVVRCQACAVFQVIKAPQSICDAALCSSEATDRHHHRFRCKICNKDTVTTGRVYFVETAQICRKKCQEFSLHFAEGAICEPLSDVYSIIRKKCAQSTLSNTKRIEKPRAKMSISKAHERSLMNVSDSDSKPTLCRPSIHVSPFLRNGEIPPPPKNIFSIQEPEENELTSIDRHTAISPTASDGVSKAVYSDSKPAAQKAIKRRIEDFFCMNQGSRDASKKIPHRTHPALLENKTLSPPQRRARLCEKLDNYDSELLPERKKNKQPEKNTETVKTSNDPWNDNTPLFTFYASRKED